eukprot:g7334.t1
MKSPLLALPAQRRALLRQYARTRHRGLIVVTEDPSDVHNVGAVLRSCEALGAAELLVVSERVRAEHLVLAPSMRKVSASANKWVPCTVYRSAAQAFDALGRRGYASVATVPASAGAVDIHSAQLCLPRLALWLGNEHHGLSAEVMKRAETLMHIPMRGHVESLNLSCTAAIALSEIGRQLSLSTHGDDGTAGAPLPPAAWAQLYTKRIAAMQLRWLRARRGGKPLAVRGGIGAGLEDAPATGRHGDT